MPEVQLFNDFLNIFPYLPHIFIHSFVIFSSSVFYLFFLLISFIYILSEVKNKNKNENENREEKEKKKKSALAGFEPSSYICSLASQFKAFPTEPPDHVICTTIDSQFT